MPNRQYCWLAPSDSDLSDGVSLSDPTGLFLEQKGFVLEPLSQVQARAQGASGWRAKKVAVTRKLTLTLLSIGPSPDAVMSHVADLQDALEAAYRGQGSDATGPGWVLWMRWGDTWDWTFFDVVEGSVGVVTAAAVEGQAYRLTASLEVLPFARGRAVRDPVIPGLTPETGTVFRANVPGDADAVCSLYLTDTGSPSVPIQGWRIGRHGHPLARLGDFSPFTPVSAAVPCGATFTRLLDATNAGGAFDGGRFDVVARVAAGAAPLQAASDLAAVAGPGGALPGGSYEYLRTAFDLAGREGPASGVAALYLPGAAILARPPMVAGGDAGWAGPAFLGGGGNVPHQLGIEAPGVAEFRAGQGPEGQTTMHLASIADGWRLQGPAEVFVYPDDSVLDDQTYLTNKELAFTLGPGGGQAQGAGTAGAIGATMSSFWVPYLSTRTGVLALQYKLRINSLALNALGGPVFLPYFLPLRIAVTTAGWYLANNLAAGPGAADQWNGLFGLTGALPSESLQPVSGPLPALGQWVTVELLVDTRSGAGSGLLYLGGRLAATVTDVNVATGGQVVSGELDVSAVLPYYTYCRRDSPDPSGFQPSDISYTNPTPPTPQYGFPVTNLDHDVQVIDMEATWPDATKPGGFVDIHTFAPVTDAAAIYAFEIANNHFDVRYTFHTVLTPVVRTSTPRFAPYAPPFTPVPYSEYQKGPPGPLAEGTLPPVASADIDICDVIVADGYIGVPGGSDPGASFANSILLSWSLPDPAGSVSRQRIYRRRDDQTATTAAAGASPYSVAQGWEYQELSATATTFSDTTDAGWIPGPPPSGTAAVQPTLIRAGAAAAGAPSARRAFAAAVAADPSLGAATPQYLDLGELPLPPVQPPVGGQSGQWTLSLEARTGSDAPPGPATVTVTGVWRLAHDEPQLWAEIGGRADPAPHAWDLVTLPDTTRSFALLFDQAHATPEGSATLAGGLTLSPGQNWVTIIPEGPGGSAAPGMTFSAQLEITPRFAFSKGLGGAGWSLGGAFP